MRGIFLFVFILLLTVGCGNKGHDRSAELKQDWTFVDLEGKEVLLSSFQGQRILVNYWATWCQPCIKEFPSLVKAEELLREEGYVFLFPSTDPLGTIEEFKNKTDMDLRFLQSKKPLTEMNIYALPATFVFNSKGELHERIDGATDWSSEQMIAKLKQVP